MEQGDAGRSKISMSIFQERRRSLRRETYLPQLHRELFNLSLRGMGGQAVLTGAGRPNGIWQQNQGAISASEMWTSVQCGWLRPHSSRISDVSCPGSAGASLLVEGVGKRSFFLFRDREVGESGYLGASRWWNQP